MNKYTRITVLVIGENNFNFSTGIISWDNAGLHVTFAAV